LDGPKGGKKKKNYTVKIRPIKIKVRKGRGKNNFEVTDRKKKGGPQFAIKVKGQSEYHLIMDPKLCEVQKLGPGAWGQEKVETRIRALP